MRADYPAVLDACVLLPMPLADTLLRLAEHPRLYLPKWSDEIMREVSRNLVKSWHKRPEQVAYREQQIRKHFPEAFVTGYEPLIASMTNELKDRHVLATAVKCGAELIVTYNAKDLSKQALAPWGVQTQGPSTFLRNLYDLDPALVVHKLHQQAQAVGIPLEDLLVRLRSNVPGFVAYLCDEQSIGLPRLKAGGA